MESNQQIAAPWTEAYSQIDQFELSFDNKLTTLPILPVQWKIIFDFMPVDVVTFDNPATSGIDWQTVANILMITNGDPDNCRIPSLFFSPVGGNGILPVLIDQSNHIQPSDWIRQPSALNLNEWTKIEMRQEADEDEDIIFTLSINQVDKFQELNPDPREFANMDVYANDKWHNTGQPLFKLGFLRNMTILIRGGKERISHKEL